MKLASDVFNTLLLNFSGCPEHEAFPSGGAVQDAPRALQVPVQLLLRGLAPERRQRR